MVGVLLGAGDGDRTAGGWVGMRDDVENGVTGWVTGIEALWQAAKNSVTPSRIKD